MAAKQAMIGVDEIAARTGLGPKVANILDSGAVALSLHDETVARLRDFLVEGGLADGARIPERELCSRFGISRTPLREALKVLAAEGLVELLPNRGARVRRLTPEDIRDLFEVMGGLEAVAGRLACAAIDEDELVRIEALHHAMYGAYLRRNLKEYFRLNQLIHESIVKASDNPVLVATYRSFAGRIRRVRFAANLDCRRDRWSEAMREHEAILDALQRRAAAEASEILYRHLQNKRVAAIEYLTEEVAATS